MLLGLFALACGAGGCVKKSNKRSANREGTSPARATVGTAAKTASPAKNTGGVPVELMLLRFKRGSEEIGEINLNCASCTRTAYTLTSPAGKTHTLRKAKDTNTYMLSMPLRQFEASFPNGRYTVEDSVLASQTAPADVAAAKPKTEPKTDTRKAEPGADTRKAEAKAQPRATTAKTGFKKVFVVSGTFPGNPTIPGTVVGDHRVAPNHELPFSAGRRRRSGPGETGSGPFSFHSRRGTSCAGSSACPCGRSRSCVSNPTVARSSRPMHATTARGPRNSCVAIRRTAREFQQT